MEIKNEPIVYTGIIVSVGDRQVFGNKGFAKRDVLISPEPDAEYPKFLQVFLTTGKKEDRTNLILEQDKGKLVKVTAFVETRKWTSKTTGKSGYMTEATVWKVEWPEGRGESADVPAPAEPEQNSIESVDVDDMPF